MIGRLIVNSNKFIYETVVKNVVKSRDCGGGGLVVL